MRKPATDGAVLGDFFIEGVRFSCSLERASVIIPAGRYRVLFTVSQRALEGELWSPDKEHRLPLIDNVPKRSGIRVHSANEAGELLGCVALGMTSAWSRIGASRVAVTQFIDKLRAADAAGEETWIQIEPADAVEMKKA